MHVHFALKFSVFMSIFSFPRKILVVMNFLTTLHRLFGWLLHVL